MTECRSDAVGTDDVACREAHQAGAIATVTVNYAFRAGRATAPGNGPLGTACATAEIRRAHNVIAIHRQFSNGRVTRAVPANFVRISGIGLAYQAVIA